MGGSQVQGWTLGIRDGNVVFIGEGPQPVGGAIAQVRTPATWYDVGADVTVSEGVGLHLKRQTSQYFYTAMVMRVSTGYGTCEPNR
ncbi:MAG: hypothetical protein Q8O76_15040, partial [Chloroflexota bacterium]|nr:hypothetical protein [Chloroflexota bacterium]